jgi:hypothetical protein
MITTMSKLGIKGLFFLIESNYDTLQLASYAKSQNTPYPPQDQGQGKFGDTHNFNSKGSPN